MTTTSTVAAPAAPRPAAPRLRAQVIATTLARVVVNTAHRMVYPFLPVFSSALGLRLETLTALLSLRGPIGVAAPAFGALPRRAGYRFALVAALLIFSVGVALPALWPGPAAFVTFVVLVAVAKFIYDPGLQAYLGDRTPYARRGLVLAFSELSWSGAALVGLPLAGLLIARFDWRAPFLPLAAAGLAAGAALWFILPRDVPAAGQPRPAASHLQAVWRNPVVLAGLSLGLLISLGNENLSVVYAAWLQRSFGLTVTALGLSATLIGCAELAGEGLVMALADRLGKRRVIAGGLVASALAYVALPLAGGSLPLALAALAATFITFEFTVVASFPLMTELAPAARGPVMTTNVAALAIGRMLADWVAGYLFNFGFLWTGVVSAASSLLALAVLVAFIREGG